MGSSLCLAVCRARVILLQELTQQVSRIDVIDEVDRCLDTLAVSVDEGGQMVKEALESVVRPMKPAGQAMIEAKARLTEQLDMSVAKLSQEIDGSVARIQQAFTQVRAGRQAGIAGGGAVLLENRRSNVSLLCPFYYHILKPPSDVCPWFGWLGRCAR